MSNLLANLTAAWGDGDDQEPNPEFFPGLLSLSESRLEKGVTEFRPLFPHFESIRQRLMVARSNLATLLSKPDEVPEDVQQVAEDNQAAFGDVEEILDQILELEEDEIADVYWEALGELEECSENLKQANLELARITQEYQS